ncbi:hypothetical protein ACFQHN_18815 [Natrialbaceae archaeon GCM10025896]
MGFANLQASNQIAEFAARDGRGWTRREAFASSLGLLVATAGCTEIFSGDEDDDGERAPIDLVPADATALVADSAAAFEAALLEASGTTRTRSNCIGTRSSDRGRRRVRPRQSGSERSSVGIWAFARRDEGGRPSGSGWVHSRIEWMCALKVDLTPPRRQVPRSRAARIARRRRRRFRVARDRVVSPNA